MEAKLIGRKVLKSRIGFEVHIEPLISLLVYPHSKFSGGAWNELPNPRAVRFRICCLREILKTRFHQPNCLQLFGRMEILEFLLEASSRWNKVLQRLCHKWRGIG